MDSSSSVNFLGSGELSMIRSMYKFSVNKSYHWFNTFSLNVADGLRFHCQTGLDTNRKSTTPAVYTAPGFCAKSEKRQSDLPLLSGWRIRGIWYTQDRFTFTNALADSEHYLQNAGSPKREDIDLLAVLFYCQCLHKNTMKYFHLKSIRVFHRPHHEIYLEVSLLERHDS